MSEHARAGELVLQRCEHCQSVQYPPREVCGNCLSDRCRWESQPSGGVVLAVSDLHNSLELFFKDQLPWTLASVQLDCGPVVLVQLEDGAKSGSRVHVSHQQQMGGSWILQARPDTSEAK